MKLSNRWFKLFIKWGLVGLFACINRSYAQTIPDYNVTNNGAIGDGKTLNTNAIQRVIDLASQRGGGRINIPKGAFLIGTLQLKSNIELHLEKGAVLLGSTSPAHYHEIDRPGFPVSPKTDDLPHLALLLAYQANNIAITGEGTIDGQGTDLALAIDSLHHAGIVVDPNYSQGARRPNEKMRPKLLGFADCNQVRLSGTTFKSPSCWGLSFELCSNIIIDGITVFNRAFWNNDGMDITDCKNVRVINSDINSADDGICLKSYYPGHFNDSIYVANCHIVSGASALKFGTASYGGFKNIEIQHIKIRDTYRSAIAIESVDGGVIENVKAEHIEAKNTGNAIFIRLGHRGGTMAGSVKNLYLHDIKVEVPFIRADINYDLRAEEPGYHNPFPSSITGIPGYPVQDITIDGLEVTYPGRATKAQAYFALSRLDQLPEKINNYPEFSMFGELPAWGLYVRHAKGITLRNIKFSLSRPDYRPAMVFQDIKGLEMNAIMLPGKASAGQIILKDVSDDQIADPFRNRVKAIK